MGLRPNLPDRASPKQMTGKCPNAAVTVPMKHGSNLPPSSARLPRGWVASLVVTLMSGLVAHAVEPVPTYGWTLEWRGLELNASNALLPMGPGWSLILTDIRLGQSANQTSSGHVFAYDQGGGQFLVKARFDVFLDYSFTDVDPSVNFGGGPVDGLSLQFPGVGPGRMETTYSATFAPNAPNFGLFPPPEAAPFIGLFSTEIFLGVDLNGNGDLDKIKVTLGALTVGDPNRTFVLLPDGTVIDSFDVTFDLSGGVVDASQDPPFGPIILTGPGTTLTTPVSSPEVPEPGTLGAGLAVGLLGMTAFWRRRG